MTEFLRKCRGYVCFETQGQNVEHFLNVLCRNNINVWGIKRNKEILSAKARTKDYFKFRPLCRKVGVRTHVTERCGLPFFLNRHRLRVGFFAGIIMFFAVLFFLSGFIWNVTVIGNETINEAEIVGVLKEMGLSEGVRRKSFDAKELRTRLVLEVDGIAWAAINVEGVRATVNIVESIPLKTEESEPCNLVAERDGVITGIEIERGTVDVKVGQSVHKGDRLVSGLTQYKDGSYRFDEAKGKVIAETERELKVVVPFSGQKVVRSGEKVKRYAVSFFGIKIPLYLGTVKGAYETESRVKYLKRDGMYLPIKLYQKTFYKMVNEDFSLSEEEAAALAYQRLSELEANQMKSVEILHKTSEKTTENGAFVLSVKYSCKENIAIKDLLLILE